jgi:hypothetical protein
VTDVLGDYSGTLDIKYLTSQDKFNNSGHNDELASTTGKRLVVSVESQEGKNFHEGNIKNSQEEMAFQLASNMVIHSQYIRFYTCYPYKSQTKSYRQRQRNLEKTSLLSL